MSERERGKTRDQSGAVASGITVGGHRPDPTFAAQVQEISSQKIAHCYQCGECTAGCPTAFAMDIKPNQVSRMVQMGLADDVLSSSAIWLCAGCETCATRCPKKVDLCRIMDSLRQIATQRGVKSPEADIQKFHETFLAAIKKTGRLHEAGMIAALKLKTRKFTQDIPLGIALTMKGKMAPLPPSVKDRAAVKKVFDKSGSGDPHGK